MIIKSHANRKKGLKYQNNLAYYLGYNYLNVKFGNGYYFYSSYPIRLSYAYKSDNFLGLVTYKANYGRFK